MQHLGVLSTCQTQFYHQLTSVTDTQRERILAGIELVEGLLGFRVVQECPCPSFCRTQHVTVGESATEDDHIDILQRLATTDQVGHHHVFHFESGQIE